MASHLKTPLSVLQAPPIAWAWAQDEDGNPIQFEGPNRAQRRAMGQWGEERYNKTGRRGFSQSSMSARSLHRE